jgi:putative transposase
MNNHYHQISAYENTSIHLSNYMRRAHGSFGMKYNILHKRSGKVAESRPKTTLIQNIKHEIAVHFYVEANPIRAGICKLEELINYKFSSYRYYAHGIRDKYTELISVPDWYLDLGKTPKQRQREYRKLFKLYLIEYGESKIPFFNSNLYYYGDVIWVREQENLNKKVKNQNTS